VYVCVWVPPTRANRRMRSAREYINKVARNSLCSRALGAKHRRRLLIAPRRVTHYLRSRFLLGKADKIQAAFLKALVLMTVGLVFFF